MKVSLLEEMKSDDIPMWRLYISEISSNDQQPYYHQQVLVNW